MATFDLMYVAGDEGRTMSCAVSDEGGVTTYGPFPAKVAGPAIVEALAAHQSLGFPDKRAAETAYVVAHFANMSRGENNAGMAYPFRAGASDSPTPATSMEDVDAKAT